MPEAGGAVLGSDRATSSGHGAEAQCHGTSFSWETHLVASWTTGDSLPRYRLVKGSVRTGLGCHEKCPLCCRPVLSQGEFHEHMNPKPLSPPTFSSLLPSTYLPPIHQLLRPPQSLLLTSHMLLPPTDNSYWVLSLRF